LLHGLTAATYCPTTTPSNNELRATLFAHVSLSYLVGHLLTPPESFNLYEPVRGIWLTSHPPSHFLSLPLLTLTGIQRFGELSKPFNILVYPSSSPSLEWIVPKTPGACNIIAGGSIIISIALKSLDCKPEGAYYKSCGKAKSVSPHKPRGVQ